MFSLNKLRPNSNLQRLVALQSQAWPDHRSFLEKSFSGRSTEVIESTYLIADLVDRLVSPEYEQFAEDYRWLCGAMFEEEIYFRRNGEYRCKTFAEAKVACYDNPKIMKSYMQGLLISQLFWANHINVLHYYRTEFLTKSPKNARFLEVGPGHGLFMCLAALDKRCKSFTGWDISETSLEATRKNINKLGLDKDVTLEHQDVLAVETIGRQFDIIVISEVLEHLERPEITLKALRKLLAPGGNIFVNVPVNSPAPDHIYLWKTPEEVARFAEEADFRVIDSRNFPVTGYTEEAARKFQCTISVTLVLT